MSKRIEDEDERVVRDQKGVRVPLMLMDSAAAITAAALRAGLAAGGMHRPGQVAVSDAARAEHQARHVAHRAKLQNAWKDSPAQADASLDADLAALEAVRSPPPEPSLGKERPALDSEAHRKHDAELESAWRNPQ